MVCKEIYPREERVSDYLIVELNAKGFVRWISQIPAKKLMKPLRAAHATSVARRLAELANANPDLNFLPNLVSDVWRLFLHLSSGRVATNEQCIRFLEDFGPYLLNHDLGKAIAALKNSAEGITQIANPNRIEYRIERPVLFVPAAFSGPKTSRRPPSDDISERLAAAVDAMTEAQCTRPIAYVADASKWSKLLPEGYCTVRHINSRIKSLGPRIPLLQQELPTWLFSYWHTLHPEYALKNVDDPEWPEKFVFTKCDC